MGQPGMQGESQEGGASGAHAQVDVGKMRARDGLFARMVEALRRIGDGQRLAVQCSLDAVPDIEQWAELTGHPIVARPEGARADGGVRIVLRKGGAAKVADDAPDVRSRLWIYTNFDCNLSCDYCCVRSAPGIPRRAIPTAQIRQAVIEARDLGVSRVFLTGGEPFIRPDIVEAVHAACDILPTTVLTNAMLFRGDVKRRLEELPRDRVTLQVSLDSPDPGVHDDHRGAGSWQRAREGILLARELGFRVRVAATVANQEAAKTMNEFLIKDGVPEEDRVIRPVALRGVAADGLALARQELVPELTVTDSGVYWHPVGATDDDFLITKDIFPLRNALALAEEQVRADSAFADRVKEVFQCA